MVLLLLGNYSGAMSRAIHRSRDIWQGGKKMQSNSRLILLLLTITAILGGCTTNVYRTQVDALHTHTEQFQNFLHREQVEAAMHETQAIELIGLQLKAGRLPGPDTLKAKDRAQLSQLLDAVREQAAINW